jgi:ketol-acid reductoisomerase
MAANYFNTLPLREQLEQLGKCRFMERDEFADGVERLRGKKLVIVGCGAQGLNQGLNLRDSGLDVSYALREAAIASSAPPGATPLRTASPSAPTRNSSPPPTWSSI